MKAVTFILTLAIIATAAVRALPISDELYSEDPYQKCVREHGGISFPYPGPGDCHDVGTCTCNPDGTLACVC
ncbi:hypothetical protein LPJ81_000860 [Coemansia sp. IMI 209127]|nr:hypothetical protein LPJ81_000860 [Coemansia sp. IMI 209127]